MTFTGNTAGNGSVADVQVFVFDDLLVEDAETFTLSMSVSISSPVSATISGPSSVTVTIIDNDCKLICLAYSLICYNYWSICIRFPISL